MKISVESFSNIYPDHLWVQLSESDLEKAKPTPQNYSNETGRNNAYFNRLCLNLFLKWMQENLGQETALSVFPNEKLLPKIWEFVNGCGINLGSKRLVLIPSNAIDMADFSVPKEWVDLPNWAADYYLPVRVDLEERYLHFWGFVSRRTLKAKADYDPIYRLYYGEGDCVIPNLELLGVALNFSSDEKGEVAALPEVSETEIENLIEELRQPSPYSPRLQATFEKWGALLNKSDWLHKLYEKRAQPFPPTIWSLNQWLNGVLETGWQTFEELFSAKTLAPAFRAKWVRGIELESPEKIRRAVRQLYNSQSEVALPPNIDEQDALLHLLQNTQDESIRWKAAEYLWTIAPNYQGGAIRRVMDLGVQMMGHPIALMVAVLRKLNGEFAVLLRAYPMSSQTDWRWRSSSKLPATLRLIVLAENGDRIPGLEAEARSEPQDDYISLYFSADVGDRFNVRLTLDNISITEQFVV